MSPLTLLVNVFITNQRFNKSIYDLPVKRESTKLEVFKYTLASYSVIPFKKVIIYYELDEEFLSFNDEINNYINSLFPQEKIVKKFRMDTKTKWENELKNWNLIPEDLIWFTCNDDHVFVDSSLDYLNLIIEKLKYYRSFNTNCSAYISHWQEAIGEAYLGTLHHSLNRPKKLHPRAPYFFSSDNVCTVIRQRNVISMQILTTELLYNIISSSKYQNDFRRTDGIMTNSNQLVLIPHKEIVRHFDAYSHVGISHDIVSVMKIPSGFFENKIKVQIGLAIKQPEYIWLHPLEINYKKNEPKPDYNWAEDEIPLFWKSRIKEIIKEEINPLSLSKAKVKRTIIQALASKFSILNPIIFVSLYSNNVLPIISKSNDIKMFREVADSMFNIRSQLKFIYKSINFSRKSKILSTAFFANLSIIPFFPIIIIGKAKPYIKKITKIINYFLEN